MPNEHEILRARSFELRTQRDEGSDDGAVLAFISMRDGHDDAPPGTGSDFRYLIPAGGGYSATVMLNPRRFIILRFVEQLLKILATHEEPIYIMQGATHSATIGNASLWVSGGSLPYRTTLYGRTLTIVVTTKPFILSSKSPEGITIKVEGRRAFLSWPVTGEVECSYYVAWDDAARNATADSAPFGEKALPLDGTVECELQLIDGPSPRLVAVGKRFVPNQPAIDPDAELTRLKAALVTGGFSQEKAAAPPSDDEFWAALIIAFMSIFVSSLVFVSIVIGLAGTLLLLPLELTLLALTNINFSQDIPSLVRNLIRLNFSEVIVGGRLRAPNDLVLFGAIAQSELGFSVAPLEPRVALGGECQFSTEGAYAATVWSVEPLVSGTPTVGIIDSATGTYRVPGDARFAGTFIRERVKATQGNRHGYALVTVTLDGLSITPLVQIVPANREIRLDAGSTKVNALFKWSIEGDVFGAALNQNQGPRVLFKAGAGDHDYPSLAKVKVEVDEVSRACCVIMLPSRSHRTLIIRVNAIDVAGRRVTLMINDSEDEDVVRWEVVQGADSGTVVPDPHDKNKAQVQVVASAIDRMMIICAELRDQSEVTVYMRGYFILPLPLHSYQSVYQFLQESR